MCPLTVDGETKWNNCRLFDVQSLHFAKVLSRGELGVDGGWRGVVREEGRGGGGTEGNREGERKEEGEKGKGVQMIH